MRPARFLGVALLLLPISASAFLQQADATFENGRYRRAGIAFEVPLDWNYAGTVIAQGPSATTAHWHDPQTGSDLYARVNIQAAAPAEITQLLATTIANKTQQRARDGYQQWRVRPESVSRTVIGGHPALAAVADYTARGDGTPRAELLTWIFAAEGRVLFFAFTTPDQLAAFQPAFDRVVRSASLP
jgi:hypothetical protein